jgi:glycosyltransferase involved in cell wall biosynthesis
MEVSVIIPAFNAEAFILKAVCSALEQSQVLEVLVVNDGSTDQTRDILKAIKNKKLRVLEHENGVNKGRSSSRNLGLQQATSEYIAFLDADDYYLPHRFDKDEYIFKNNNCDGVYNAIGAHFYRACTAKEKAALDLYMVSEEVAPENLFKELITGRKRHFSIDGLTLKSRVLKSVGLFNEKLPVAEDTEFIWRVALNHKLVTGHLNKPVAKRGVHQMNVFDDQVVYKDRLLEVCEILLEWVAKNKAPKEKTDLILKTIWNYRYKKETSMAVHTLYWYRQFFKNPNILFTLLIIKYFPVVRRRKKVFSFLYKN